MFDTHTGPATGRQKLQTMTAICNDDAAKDCSDPRGIPPVELALTEQPSWASLEEGTWLAKAVGNRFLARLRDSDRVKDMNKKISRLGMRDIAKFGMAIAPLEEGVTAQDVKTVGAAVEVEDLRCSYRLQRMERQALKNEKRQPMAIEQRGQFQSQIWSPQLGRRSSGLLGWTDSLPNAETASLFLHRLQHK